MVEISLIFFGSSLFIVKTIYNLGEGFSALCLFMKHPIEHALIYLIFIEYLQLNSDPVMAVWTHFPDHPDLHELKVKKVTNIKPN